jgi:predicted  nucleic acid-binding Zn-ribbon protein
MILEGFEIENWTCIKKLTVAGLPPTGVIVLHGPNRTGKSSLVQALRACLMDYASTSKALNTRYPRGRAEKPTVSVTFSASGKIYRIKKCFGSNKSEFASRTSTGAWKVETTSAAEAHSRMCACAGGDDSNKGLSQILWLTQAEFRLPEPKKFDTGVQAQLRGILGVLQTPLDDRFIERVKKRWNVWHSGQRKAGKEQQIKDGCKLSQNLSDLAKVQGELNESELKFKDVEGFLRETENLESRAKDLAGQSVVQERQLQECLEERERSQGRINARKIAEERFAHAKKEQETADQERQQRANAAQRLAGAADIAHKARTRIATLEEPVDTLEHHQRQRKADLNKLRGQRLELRQQATRADARLLALEAAENLKLAQKEVEDAQSLAAAISEIKNYIADNPAPDKVTLNGMKEVYNGILGLRAERNAASMTLTVVRNAGAAPAQLAVDGAPVPPLTDSHGSSPISVRRKAELRIPAWGRVEFSRELGSGDVDQIETSLAQRERDFANEVVRFGIAATDSDALDQVLSRSAEIALKSDELRQKEDELKERAPRGLEHIQRKVTVLKAKLKDAALVESETLDLLASDSESLKTLKAELDSQIASVDSQISSLEEHIESAESDLGNARTGVTNAKEELAGFEATAKALRDELARLRTEARIAQRVGDAEQDLKQAERELTGTQLTSAEASINERLTACKELVDALEQQMRENEEKYNRLKGRLEESEGLHSRRAALGARVEELARLTEREALEKGAVDRLYELFEECREKQLGTLMGPIHDRVVNWMRVLDIGDYKELHFNDSFLPDKLLRRDGTAEFAMDEES